MTFLLVVSVTYTDASGKGRAVCSTADLTALAFLSGLQPHGRVNDSWGLVGMGDVMSCNGIVSHLDIELLLVAVQTSLLSSRKLGVLAHW